MVLEVKIVVFLVGRVENRKEGASEVLQCCFLILVHGCFKSVMLIEQYAHHLGTFLHLCYSSITAIL